MTEVRWVAVCALEDLVPERGVAALVDGRQVALFRLMPDDEVLAISNHDPFSRANVLARGIVGSVGDAVVVASPMYKQHFDLRAGRSIEDPEITVDTFPTRICCGRVEVGVKMSSTASTGSPSCSPPGTSCPRPGRAGTSAG